MTLRDRVKSFLLKDEITGMRQTLDIMEQAWRRGPAILSEENIYRALQEADSWLVDHVLRQRGWQLWSASVLEFSEEDRRRAVEDARYMYLYDVNTARAVNSWTDFGFGQIVEVLPDDEELAKIWREFWHARRNQPILGQTRIHRLSNQLINDGEVFLVAFGSRLEGKTTVRRVQTLDITEIVYEPDDPDVPLYYVRQRAGKETIYYPDWRASEAQLELFEIPRGAVHAADLSQKVAVDGKLVPVTSVRMMHVIYDDIGGRGWPMLTRTLEWSRVLRNFLGDRAAVTKRAAMFVDEIVHGAGSRATDAIEAKFDSTLGATEWGRDTNPAPPAGSMLVHNKAIDVIRRPLTTGAGDAMSDGQMFASQVSTGSNMPLHWMGWPQALSNRATAREMARPIVEQLNRYQRIWVQVFTDMVEIVALNSGQEFEDVGATVNLQAPIDTDTEEVARAMTSITDAVAGGAVDPMRAIDANNKLTNLALTTLNLQPMEEGEEPKEPEAEESALAEVAQLALEQVQAGSVEPEWVLKWLVGELKEWEKDWVRDGIIDSAQVKELLEGKTRREKRNI